MPGWNEAGEPESSRRGAAGGVPTKASKALRRVDIPLRGRRKMRRMWGGERVDDGVPEDWGGDMGLEGAVPEQDLVAGGTRKARGSWGLYRTSAYKALRQELGARCHGCMGEHSFGGKRSWEKEQGWR